MHSTARPTTEYALALRSFVVTCSCFLLQAHHYLWMREAAEARPVLALRVLSAKTCSEKARMHPAGDGARSASMRSTAKSAACRVPCQSDIQLLVRRRLPVHEPESEAAWMGCAAGVR